MKLPRVRFTVLRLMAVVASAALVLWLAVTAARVCDDRESSNLYHYWHRYGDHRISSSIEAMCNEPAPFWPRYWRRLLGFPWPGSYDCTYAPFEDLKGGLAITIASPDLYENEPEVIARVARRARAEWVRKRREARKR